ncbi:MULTISPECIES: hypothetical protein [unclassified Pseudomonas]|uniref:DUF6124 family protein n=1 Tax=unclassified Pseudomonas TaxID=196821 RepID=UPI000D33C534|nr:MULTISPECIES: hypothetical protein [unclassified Pseudomonas]RAU48779.1 hypothetical protein DBP26_004525 [Pseudomonas sp. RIT 409]RAU53961.1 hypothetical protein DBY65_010540 [Pseudomonas sp. RIT 412]
MIQSTPHPPETPVTQSTPFGVNLGSHSLFNVQSGIRVDDALVLVSEFLSCAAATAYESADNCTAEFRPLARSVVHQIEAAKALVEASLAGLAVRPTDPLSRNASESWSSLPSVHRNV